MDSTLLFGVDTEKLKSFAYYEFVRGMFYWLVPYITPLMTIFIYHYFGLQYRRLPRSKWAEFDKIKKYAMEWGADDKQIGIMYGKWFMATRTDYEIRIFSTVTWYKNQFDNVTEKNNTNISNKIITDKSNKATIVTYLPNKATSIRLYYHGHAIQYALYSLPVFDYKPHKQQKSALDKIMNVYSTKKICIALIHGPPGKGKSAISSIVAGKFLREDKKPYICNNLALNLPGQSINALYGRYEINESNPLILLLDEIDIIIADIHKENKNYVVEPSILIKNKKDWNRLFDDINDLYYPYMILIMTSNKPIEWFNELDSSYFRENRTDLIMEIN